MNKTILMVAALMGVLSIILGAFGAHALKASIGIDGLQTFEIGVRYQMYHAFLLLFIGNTDYLSLKTKKIILYLVVIGVFFFSFSIYGLSTNALTDFNFKAIGFVTPIVGLILISAWVLMVVNFSKFSSKKGVKL